MGHRYFCMDMLYNLQVIIIVILLYCMTEHIYMVYSSQYVHVIGLTISTWYKVIICKCYSSDNMYME